jgi:hypothetical protein
MTIMVAGGLTIAIPGVMPEAMAANANLYVSAENSQFSNYMTGPQVVEVVVIDDDIDETNESNGEPDVTINGAKLRMAQATDGNWYGYFADKTQAQRADGTTETLVGGVGLDFGQFCSSASTALHSDETTQLFSDTVGVAIPIRTNSTASTAFGVNGTDTIGNCNTSFHGKTSSYNNGYWNTVGAAADIRINANSTYSLTTATGGTVSSGVAGSVSNVVREAKAINTNTATGNGIGQIDLLDDGLWPFIQLYDLTAGGDVNIQYSKGGGVQTTTLVFDTADDLASFEFDRTVYPRSAHVHMTIKDVWLNIDPTDEDSWTFGTDSTTQTYYQVFDENGSAVGATNVDLQSTAITGGASGNQLGNLMGDDVILFVNANPQGKGLVLDLKDNANNVVTETTGNNTFTTADSGPITDGQPITVTETSPHSAHFVTYDENDVSTLQTTSGAARGTTATIKYNDSSQSVLIGFDFASIDIQPIDDTWNSGEEIPVVLKDQDVNKNSRVDEDIKVRDNTKTLIPSLITGDPFTLSEATNASRAVYCADVSAFSSDDFTCAKLAEPAFTVDSFSKVGRLAALTAPTDVDGIVIDYQTTFDDFRQTFGNTQSTAGLKGVNLLNYDVRALNTTGTVNIWLLNSTTDILTAAGAITPKVGSMAVALGQNPSGLVVINGTTLTNRLVTAVAAGTGLTDGNDNVGLAIVFVGSTNTVTVAEGATPFVADFFSFGFTSDGYDSSQRVANQIIRLELEESGDNTAEFVGTLEYVMINQLSILDSSVYSGITSIGDEASFIVIEDLTDEDAPRVNYLDLGADGVSTQIADQQEAPTHSGVVSFDNDNYKVADTVTVTLEDADLNTDSSLIDVFTVVATGSNYDMVGSTTNSRTSLSDGTSLTRLLDITFDDEIWLAQGQGTTCTGTVSGDDGLAASGFTLVETGVDSGVFVGDFQVPGNYCARASGTGTQSSTTGTDIEVNYVDFRDASGETIEVGDGAGIRANTGSVTLDRTVYPVPFGVPNDFISTNTSKSPTNANGSLRSVFPIHATGIDQASLQSGEFIANGDLTIHVRVNDPDYDVSASGEDQIPALGTTQALGVVKVSVIRGSDSVILGYAGSAQSNEGKIDVGTKTTTVASVRQFGPMVEIAPDAGIFESDITIKWTDGPASTVCPDAAVYAGLNGTSLGSELVRFDGASTTSPTSTHRSEAVSMVS